MTRRATLALLITLGACAHAAPPRPTCTALTADIRAQATAAEAFTQAESAAAMARAKVTTILLPSRQLEGGAPSDDVSLDGFRPFGTVFELDGKSYVAGPLISVPNGQLAQPYFEFVENEAGDIFQLERAVDVKSTGTAVLCGCGPVGSGAAPHAEQVVYELPPGRTFRGVVTIAYAARLYTFSYSGTDERGQRCEPPP
jgi:hypothetical protein